ncbi:MAG: hypothetical protein HRT61_02940 [Ekhidna sp.]|nr:hypothetical protein [Ekhidna sp.]
MSRKTTVGSKASNRDFKTRKTIGVSDWHLFDAAQRAALFKKLFREPYQKVLFACFFLWLRFSKAISAMPFWCNTGYKAGIGTMGIFANSCAIINLIGWNSTYVPFYLKPFSLLVLPFTPFFYEGEELVEMAISFESEFLAVWTGLFMLTSTTHLIMIWFKKGNKSQSKRGESFLRYLLLKVFKSVDDYVICGVIQPIIGVSVGVWLIHQYGDAIGGTVLLLGSLAEMHQQAVDHAAYVKTKGILNI